MHRTMRKITAAAMTAVLTLAITGSGSLRAAAASPSEKEEVIYAMMDGNGQVDGVYAVNIVNGGEILDYGDYRVIQNMTTTDELTYQNGVTTGFTEANRLYYKGTMENARLPWNIAVTYQIDGRRYTAEEAAGKSGHLELSVSITRNPLADASFFENYSLQVTIPLDTRLCRNITCEDATEANAGSVRQLTYTILAGNEKDIQITADVTDFETTGISINGIRMNLGISKDSFDTSVITENTDELKEASEGFDQAAAGLQEGAGQIKDGSSSLLSAEKTYQSGILRYTDGVAGLFSGSSLLTSGTKDLQNGAGSLTSGASELKDGIQEYTGGVGRLTDGILSLQDQLSGLSIAAITLTDEQKHQIQQAAAGSDQIAAGASALSDSISSSVASGISSQIQGSVENIKNNLIGMGLDAAQAEAIADTVCNEIASGITADGIAAGGLEAACQSALESAAGAGAVQGAQATADQMNTQLSGYAQLFTELRQGVAQLAEGAEQLTGESDTLAEGAEAIRSGSAVLAEGTDRLVQGARQLIDGLESLQNNSSDLKSGLSQIIDGTSQLTEGSSELYNGTGILKKNTETFADSVSGIDQTIEDKVEEVITGFTKSDYIVKSFVSDQNTNVTGVQFVMKVAPVEIAEAEPVIVEDEPKNPGFLAKLKGLFE